MAKFVGLFSVVDCVIPILFSVVWAVFEKAPHAWLTIGAMFVEIQLLFWPSSIVMMATAGPNGNYYSILAISIAMNMVFYAMIGFGVWWGLNRWRWMLHVIIGVIGLLWFMLLRM